MPEPSDKTGLSSPIYGEISQLLTAARSQVRTTVNTVMVQTYWQIGRIIVEEEQKGEDKADYGKRLISDLSEQLGRDFGSGFSEVNLRHFRHFYLAFSIQHALSAKSRKSLKNSDLSEEFSIQHSLSDELTKQTGNLYSARKDSPSLRPELSWTHYRHLLKVEDQRAREWYMNEAAEENWSTRALERQINSLHYERPGRYFLVGDCQEMRIFRSNNPSVLESSGSHGMNPVFTKSHVLHLRPQEREGWQSLRRVFQRSTTVGLQPQLRRGSIDPSPLATGTRLLRGLSQSTGRNKSRKISQDRLGETLPQEPPQGIFRGFYFIDLPAIPRRSVSNCSLVKKPAELGARIHHASIPQERHKVYPVRSVLLCQRLTKLPHRVKIADSLRIRLSHGKELAKELEKEVAELEGGKQ